MFGCRLDLNAFLSFAKCHAGLRPVCACVLSTSRLVAIHVPSWSRRQCLAYKTLKGLNLCVQFHVIFRYLTQLQLLQSRQPQWIAAVLRSPAHQSPQPIPEPFRQPDLIIAAKIRLFIESPDLPDSEN